MTKCEYCKAFNPVPQKEGFICDACGVLNYPRCGLQPKKPKRRLHRKKVLKGMFYHFKGNMLWKYHAYQSNRNSKSIMLCNDETGNELYFNNWKAAKKYLRTMPPRKEQPWP